MIGRLVVKAGLATDEEVDLCDSLRQDASAAGHEPRTLADMLLANDYVAYVHGNVMTEGPDAEVAAIERWWAACSDVHLEPITMVERDGLVTLRYTLSGTNDGNLFGQPACLFMLDVDTSNG